MATEKVLVELVRCTCNRCGHVWLSPKNILREIANVTQKVIHTKFEKPSVCPKKGCMTRYWDREAKK